MLSTTTMCSASSSSSSTTSSKTYTRLQQVGEKLSSSKTFISSSTPFLGRTTNNKQFRTCSITGAVIEVPSYYKVQSSTSRKSYNKERTLSSCAETTIAIRKSSLKAFRRFAGCASNDLRQHQDSSSHTVTTVDTDECTDDSFRTISSETPVSLLLERDGNNEATSSTCMIEYSNGILTGDVKDNSPLSVSFGDLDIYEFPRAVGDNPAVSAGPPITIGVKHISVQQVSVDDYEAIVRRRHPLTKEQMKLSPMVRMDILKSVATLEEILNAKNESEDIRLRRAALIKALIQKKRQKQQLQQQQGKSGICSDNDGMTVRKNMRNQYAAKLVTSRGNNERTGFVVHGLKKRIQITSKGLYSS